MRNCFIILLTLIFFSCAQATAKHLHLEKEYQKAYADRIGGIVEYQLPDHTRVDILTPIYAIEVDFAQKWAESIGQALYYAIRTERKPAVLLILENPLKEYKYLLRLRTVAERYNITIFTITPAELNGQESESDLLQQ